MASSVSTPLPSSAPSGREIGTVACDLAPLAVLSIEGADAESFLQGQLSNDLRRLAPDAWQRTTYNSPKGRVLANFLLWRHGEGYRALVSADIADAVRKRLSMFVLRSKVTVADASASLVRVGLVGPDARLIVESSFGAVPGPGGVARGASGEVLALAGERFVALVPAHDGETTQALTAGSAGGLAPYAVWMWHGIRAGEPLVTSATQDQFVLQTANLDVLGAVSFEKGCYTGQEIVARTQYLGRLKERLFGYHVDDATPAPGTKLYGPLFGEQACGTVVNAAPAPAGGVDFLAVVQTAAAEGEVRLSSLEGPRVESFALPYDVPAPTAPRRPG